MLLTQSKPGFIGMLILVLSLQACGQKGPLYLPEDDEEQSITENQVTI
ncbi:MAG: lipoprotein [Gammaproteobacteria bacterium]|nr:lipoprotein [Gammaproteobacteria bacterium]